ncbi:WXG100 family type VII secretion target [Nonomuraea endophytica]|uniref:WXG100 family type VII secretion target n=1 Tax=Nonomuraea endophytica TaxID=714136 RepID=UPI0037CC0BDF
MSEDIYDVTKINYGGLSTGETEFGTAFRNLVTTLETLQTELDKKTAIWQGEAKVVYESVKVTWQTEAKDLAQFVDLLAKNINITSMNMRQVEKVNSQIFDGR